MLESLFNFIGSVGIMLLGMIGVIFGAISILIACGLYFFWPILIPVAIIVIIVAIIKA